MEKRATVSEFGQTHPTKGALNISDCCVVNFISISSHHTRRRWKTAESHLNINIPPTSKQSKLLVSGLKFLLPLQEKGVELV